MCPRKWAYVYMYVYVCVCVCVCVFIRTSKSKDKRILFMQFFLVIIDCKIQKGFAIKEMIFLYVEIPQNLA